jgi:hypothetical protein
MELRAWKRRTGSLGKNFSDVTTENSRWRRLEEGSAFVPWVGGDLAEILCEHHLRTVGADNCVKFGKRTLQLPADRHRCHYVKAKVEVHRYPDGQMALFHGPRKLAGYTAEGKEVKATEETKAIQKVA